MAGACVAGGYVRGGGGGMHGRGVCMAGVCVWWGACMVGGGCDRGVHAGGVWQVGICDRGACVAEGHVWRGGCVTGDMHAPLDRMTDECKKHYLATK